MQCYTAALHKRLVSAPVHTGKASRNFRGALAWEYNIQYFDHGH